MAQNQDKEQSEEKAIKVFIDMFNIKYRTDYEVGPAENQNSIVDRKAISRSKKHKELLIQLKSIREFDDRPFTRSIMGKNVRVFDSNIFRLLTPFLEILFKKKFSANGIVLVLDVGVPESWLKDYCLPGVISKMNFDGVYCFSTMYPSYIFVFKELSLLDN